MNHPIKKIIPLGFPWETQDPFLFCVHHLDFYPKGNEQLAPAVSLEGRDIGQDFNQHNSWRMYHGSKVPGFPSHPHRGFETVTIVQKGFIDHSDSLGAAARFGNGDVQWMTAGKGVQHSEMFPLLSQENENPLELFQIWLNLPKAGKYVDPYFQMIWHENIPVISEKDDHGNTTTIKIVAGNYGDSKAVAPPPDSWAAGEDHDVAIWVINMDPNAIWTLPKSGVGINRNLYFFEGKSLFIGDEEIPSNKGMEMGSSADVIIKNGSEPGRLLMLQGKPIKEPVVQHGPFVMNNEMEIRQTILDYQKGQFGGWPWPSNENVHAKERGRFAKYVDGSEEDR